MTSPAPQYPFHATRITRRQLLQAAGMGLGATALAPLLAACSSATTTATSTDPFAADLAGLVNFANWSLYIDHAQEKNGTTYIPSMRTFTQETGIQVNYREVISDAEIFSPFQA